MNQSAWDGREMKPEELAGITGGILDDRLKERLLHGLRSLKRRGVPLDKVVRDFEVPEFVEYIKAVWPAL